MAKRKMSAYQLFATSFLRARSRPGMGREQLQELMREAGRAWQRARRGHNPFPEMNLYVDDGEAGRTPCPHCGEMLEIPAGAHGKQGRCGVCGGTFEIEVA